MKKVGKVKHEWSSSGEGRVLTAVAVDEEGQTIARVNVLIPSAVDPMGKVFEDLKGEIERATSEQVTSLARTLIDAIT